MNTKIKDNQKGFTAVEILVVIAIISILAGMGLFVSMDFYRDYSFRADRDMAISILERARAKSLANINGSAHGIYADGSDIIIFQGNSYLTRDTSYDENISLSSNSILSGEGEVIFEQLSGNSNVVGDVIISNGGRVATISLNSEGRINY